MTDRPIIFSAPMVRALLREIESPGSGKTMTRRLADRFSPLTKPCPPWTLRAFDDGRPSLWVTPSHWRKCQPGDRCYVQEGWRTDPERDHLPPRDVPNEAPRLFEADDPERSHALGLWGRWRTARFMPRRLSRLTLYVNDVKVERLQEISEDDCEAEGIKQRWTCLNPGIGSYAHDNNVRDDFRDLWNSLHTKPGTRWEDNPWVVAPSFKPVLGNIDSLPEAA